MLQSIKRLTKHSLVYGIGHIVSRFVGFLLLPIHANVMLPEEYRTPALLFSSLAIMNVIFSYGMDVAFLRFFILADDESEKRRIFSTAFWMILITGTIFSTIMLLTPEPFSRLIFRSESQVGLIRLAAGILLADALALLPYLVLRAQEKSGWFVGLKTANIVLNVGLNILFVVVLRRGATGIFTANLIASIFTLCTLLPVIIGWLRLSFSKSSFKELFRFGIPYLPSGLAFIVMDQIGRFFLDRMAGEAAAGTFSAVCKLGIFMNLIVAAFRFAWHPFFLSTSKQEDAPQIFARVLTYFVLITGGFFLAVSLFIEDIVRLRIGGFGLLQPEYFTGLGIVPIILLAYVGYGVYTNFMVGIYLEKKTLYLPIVTGSGAIISIVMNRLLIPDHGIFGAAWATLGAYSGMALILFFISRRLYPIPYEGFRLTKIVLIFGGLFGLFSVAFPGLNWALRLALLVLSFPLLGLVGFFHPDEVGTLKRLVSRTRGSRTSKIE